MSAFIGTGTKLTFIPSSTDTASTLGCITSIDGPDAEFEIIDVTCLDSTAIWREFKKGDGDPGTVTVQGFFDNSSGAAGDAQALLSGLLTGSTATTWSVVFNNTQLATESFDGFLTGFSRGTIERNTPIPFTLTIKVSSDPGFFPSS